MYKSEVALLLRSLLFSVEDADEGDEGRGRDRLDSMASVSLDEQVEFLEEKLGVLQSLNRGARKVWQTDRQLFFLCPVSFLPSSLLMTCSHPPSFLRSLYLCCILPKVREKALRKELNALRRQMRAERKALRQGSG